MVKTPTPTTPDAAAKPADEAPTSLDFEDVESVPVAAPRRQNLFTTQVQALSDNWNDEDGRSKKATAVTVPESFVSRAKKDIGAAAKALATPRTARIVTDAPVDGKVRITFYLRTKIEHPGRAGKASSEKTAE